jgi:hypothetical protein
MSHSMTRTERGISGIITEGQQTMNENQHVAKVRRDNARVQVRLLEDDLAEARWQLAEGERNLASAILLDRASWDATPRHEKARA